jgi:streptomycin 6-kinase
MQIGWDAWVVTDLDDLVGEWQLRPDGEPVTSPRATVLSVRTADGPAVLKLSAVADDAHLVLRRWNGDGAARLLRADPHRRAVLLERLESESLNTLWDIDACHVVGGLYARLHVPALPNLPSLPSLLGQSADDFAALPRSAPLPHRLVEQAVALCRELATEPAFSVLHGNLHFGNVLAASRTPWLAISPAPLNGDPHYELAPMLWQRWDELADAVRWGVQQRLYNLIEAAGFDEDKAKAWTIVRIVREALRNLGDPGALTRLVTLAKAVQD